jgi:hypothetical protein
MRKSILGPENPKNEGLGFLQLSRFGLFFACFSAPGRPRIDEVVGLVVCWAIFEVNCRKLAKNHLTGEGA